MIGSRYNRNEIKIGYNNKMVFSPKIYPNIELRDDDIYVATETGDRLDTLAHYYYGDSTLWWIIASANNIHDAVFALPDGTILRIPVNYNDIISNYNYN